MYGFLIRKKRNVIFNKYVMCMGSHKEENKCNI